jgi:CRP-like cAMP-binding protein
MSMQVKKLNKGDVLWWHGEFATTIAFVDKGRLGIKSEEGLIGVVGADGVIGESALLAEGGVVPKRRAAVIAIEESVVTEYPVSFVREGAGVGLPRKVLRTLIGQTVTSACFVLAAHPDVPLVMQSMSALIRSLSESKQMVSDVKNWKDFAPDFAYLFALRDAIGDLRTRLVPAKYFVARSESLLRASALLKTLVADADIATFLDKFIAVEKERIEAVEMV